MYFCKDENVYKPSNGQMLYSFCAELVDILSDLISNHPEKSESFTVIGKFNGVYLNVRNGDTVITVVNKYRMECTEKNIPMHNTPAPTESPEPKELIDAEENVDMNLEHRMYECTNTITNTLRYNKVDFWINYDSKEDTYLIKFGKELNMEETRND